MIDIFVQRGAGDYRGEDIVDPLLSALEPALDRGRAELDSTSVLQQPIQVTTKFRTGVRLGQLAEFHDSLQGVSWKGKITGIQHSIQGSTVTTVLEVIRPVVFF